MTSRRSLLLGLGAAPLALMAPSLFAGSAHAPRPHTGLRTDLADPQPNEFSGAVADGLFGSFSSVMLNPGDPTRLVVAAHAWNVTQEYFGEIGLFATGDELVAQADLNAALAALADMPRQVVSIAAGHGARLRVETLQARVAALTPDRVAEAMAELQEHGVVGTFDRVSQTFAEILADRSTRKPGQIAAEVSGCQYLAMIEATLWILAGLYTFGCAATMGVCAPCCIAAAVLAIAAGVLDLIGAYYC